MIDWKNRFSEFMSDPITELQRQLRTISDVSLRKSGQRYFKEPVKMYGTKTAQVIGLAKSAFRTIRDKPKQEIFGLCERLFSSGYMEESFIACEWAYGIRAKYEPGDFEIFGNWIKTYVGNWATCDTLCNHSVGALLEQYPDCVGQLRNWAKSENPWMRRGSAVSLILPARKGKFLPDIFAIAELLLKDREDLVQKGYGWMLKAASQSHQQEVFDFVMKHTGDMPRTALRYAIEKMPPALRQKAMERT